MLGEILLAGINVHIILMLVLVIAGYGLGQSVSWVIGLPIICVGLYCFDLGGKKGRSWRQKQEEMFILLGLLAIPFIILANIMGWKPPEGGSMFMLLGFYLLVLIAGKYLSVSPSPAVSL